MLLSKLQNTWSGVRAENTLFRFSIPIMSVALLIAVIALASKDPVVVVQPPNMNGASELRVNAANQKFKQAYALYTVSMMSNVTPGNAPFLVDTLSDIFAPRIYNEVKAGIMDQVDLITEDGLSISFSPRGSDYWPDTDRVVVYGTRTVRGRDEQALTNDVVYELTVTIQNYLPQVTFIETYEGTPRRES
ncbi:type IV conjugative transfer system protein TraE [Marinobacter goseongensis]|uniref:type IV conjugative transfer system protein TraE n=1 Tax=Marinobacter goseongensis TaxID=453838 RepID=UPI002005591E|nr:type IV conjugative transfer system protein TraE [Marinobacter goseongensis]MCK7553387.1 type IV conjugative transfer system protein TraE [Marinobacter goseongensis]